MKNWPTLPAVSSALKETLEQHGVNTSIEPLTDEDRERAARFDVEQSIKDAEFKRDMYKRKPISETILGQIAAN